MLGGAEDIFINIMTCSEIFTIELEFESQNHR